MGCATGPTVGNTRMVVSSEPRLLRFLEILAIRAGLSWNHFVVGVCSVSSVMSLLLLPACRPSVSGSRASALQATPSELDGTGFPNDADQHRPEPPIVPSLQEQEALYQASPLDGKGTATLEPLGPVHVRERGTWTIRYVAGPEGILAGGGVVIHVSPFWRWTEPQHAVPEAPGYVAAHPDPASIQLSVDTQPDMHIILVRFGDGGLPPGASVAVTYGAGEGSDSGATADVYAEEDEDFFVKVDGDGDGFFIPLPLDLQPRLTILPAPAARLIVTVPSRTVPRSTIDVRVAALDPYGNYASAYTGDVLVTSESLLPDSDRRQSGLGVGSEGQVRTPATPASVHLDHGLGTARVTLPDSGVLRFLATDSGFPGVSFTSNPILVDASPLPWNQYWGDLHGHSSLSDGSGTPDQYFRYARDVSALDVAALTDHDAFGVFAIDEHAEVWHRLYAAAQRFNDPGTFVTFPGYEWTSWKYGHMHILFRDAQPPPPLFSSRDERTDQPEELWRALGDRPAITVPHHPAGGPVATDWDHYDPSMEPIAEISSIHGVSECPGAPREIYHAVRGCYLLDAWRRGYRLGIVGSGDTHNGHPGQGDPFSPNSGLAAIYATDCTRKAVWDAIQARRVYATTGPRIILEFWANKTFLGGEVHTPLDKPIRLQALAVGTASIATIEVLLDGDVLVRQEAQGPTALLSFELPGPHHAGSFLYLRVEQEDGEMAWSSPIWITPSSA